MRRLNLSTIAKFERLKIITIVVPDILIAENANNIILKFLIIVHIESTTKSKS